MIRTIRGPDGDTIRVGAYADIAHALGVTNKQVYMWYKRRHRNGFPAPVCHRKAGNGRGAPHFDIDAIRVWFLYYEPPKGGWYAQRRNST